MKFLKRLRGHKAVRYASLCLALVVGVLAAAIVTSITVDLGPALRRKAETEGSKYIERPMRIGAMKIHLLSGKVLVEDVVIDGLHKGDRPFFTAKQLAVALDWAPAFSLKQSPVVAAVR